MNKFVNWMCQISPAMAALLIVLVLMLVSGADFIVCGGPCR